MSQIPVLLNPTPDFHLFEPPDLWQTRIDRALRDRAPRIERSSVRREISDRA